MARKSKHSDSDYIIDYNDPSFFDIDSVLEERSESILSEFGKGVNSGPITASPKKSAENKPKSPLEALKANLPKKAGEEQEGYKTAETLEQDILEEKPVPAEKPAQNGQEMSLLEKLKRYTTDETGHDVAEDESPLYKLESVAQIIKNNSSSLLGKLSEKYDVTVDTLGRPTNEDYLLKGFEDEVGKTGEEKIEQAKKTESKPTPTPAFEKMADDSKKRFEKNIFDELFPKENNEEQISTDTVPDISDIDNSGTENGIEETETRFDTATIRFTPIVDKKGNTGRINISSSTRAIDISQELTNADNVTEEADKTALEVSDFDLFVPKDEITDIDAQKSVTKKLARKRRRYFLSGAICSVCVFVLLLFLIPALADKIISSTGSTMAFCSVILFITIIANADMFKDLVNLFKWRAGHDSLLSLCAVFSIPLCIFSSISGENIYHIILLTAILMLTRSVCAFLQVSTMLSNLRQIKGKAKKNAVSFIKDNATAVAMAKDSIEGDVLIAAPRKADFISDFMKFSLFKQKLSGKVTVLFIITVILSALGAAMSYFYYKNTFSVLYSAAIATIIAAMPTVCFIDILPLFSAAKKLNRTGAMITGTYGADIIELSNAAVVNTKDIFPAGSIVLKSLKVLSNNNIDKTIVNAAALTSEIGSPLAPIFNKIAGTNTSYKKPDSDTIKYEERLGVSGWVDNELLFIGNRTLLEAHGIEAPSIEVDKKILKNGCFPVYVATANAACALIIVQYVVRSDIQKLLRKISKLGITMLFDNCDPNVNENMICDYFGLYEDSVKIMTNVGAYMCKNATTDTNMISAPASFKGNSLSLLKIMSCASGIRISNKILSIYYILASILGIWYFAFTSFTVSGGLLSGGSILMFEMLATAMGLISFLIKKP